MIEKFRADFVNQIMHSDLATGKFTVLVKPDPRRYTEHRDESGIFFIDRFLKMRISRDELFSGMRSNLPIYTLSSTITQLSDYKVSRLNSLDFELGGGGYLLPSEAVKKQASLTPSNISKDLGFISVDICGSTKLRAYNEESFDKSFAIMVRELGTLVGSFHGSILKTTGDGFQAYIDHPSFTSLCDALVGLGSSCLQLMEASVNPALKRSSLPTLDIRIGADYGHAVIREVSIPTTGFSSLDAYSNALNLAVKIQESCESNEMRVGYNLYKLLHVTWLEKSSEVSPESLPGSISPYRVFKIT